ncbi:MAG: hypothetical protein J6A42_08115 [Firmicutes bacterium]|nr:hypothetical protein [Bacillota bacterium]
MKQLVCEMCGSTDIIKQEGVFVCQSCGCKYSVDEARKMMIEGTVDVSGSTIKVDNTEELARLYQIARRAKDSDNITQASKYYDMILGLDPLSWEANFYTFYYNSLDRKRGEISSIMLAFEGSVTSTLSLIKDSCSQSNELYDAVAEVLQRTGHLIKVLQNSESDRIIKETSNESIFSSNGHNQFMALKASLIHLVNACSNGLANNFGDDKELSELADSIKNAMVTCEQSQHVPEKFNEVVDLFEKKIAIMNYWSTHQNEWMLLTNEKKQLNADAAILCEEIAEFTSQMNAVPAKAEFDELSSQHKQLKTKLNALGLFAGNKKRELQAQIAECDAKIRTVESQLTEQQEKYKEEISVRQSKLLPLNQRLNEINIELTKDR